MATDFPVEISDDTGTVRLSGTANFPDPDNQPAAQSEILDQSGAGSPAGVVTPDAIGHRYTDLTAGAVYVAIGLTHDDWIQLGGPLDTTVEGGSGVDASNHLGSTNGSLSAVISFVTVQAGAPGADFEGPLVFDSTAVTGGLYAWDGAAYQKVGDPL